MVQMSMFELEHPLGQDIETIHSAVSMGLINDAVQEIPHIKMKYKDPLELGVDYASIRLADWSTDNMAAIIYPLAVAEDDPDWQVLTEDGPKQVRQRIRIRDILGRGFPLDMDGRSFVSSYVQLDILDDGIVLIGEDSGVAVMGKGTFESKAYDTMNLMPRRELSLNTILGLAKEA